MDEATRRMLESHKAQEDSETGTEDWLDGLREDREDLGHHRDELTESLAELKRREVPRVSLEVDEEELRYLEETLGETRNDDPRPEGRRVYEKIKHLLMVETGMGGKFYR